MNNLQRVKVIHNPNYKPSGIKSYVYLLRKCKYALVSLPPGSTLSSFVLPSSVGIRLASGR